LSDLSMAEKAACWDALEALVKRDSVSLDLCINGDYGPPMTIGVWLGVAPADPLGPQRPNGHGPTLAAAVQAAARAGEGGR